MQLNSEIHVEINVLNIKILNTDILNDLNYTLKIKLHPPAGGGKSLILSLNHSFN